MITRNYVQKDRYYDSVLLMRLAGQIGKSEGVRNISVGMGTLLNKDTLRDEDLLTPEGEKAGPNDLIVAVAAADEAAAQKACQAFWALINRQGGAGGEEKYRSLEMMSRTVKDRNLAVISLAGEYAAAPAQKALELGMDVFMFSDNVPIEQEIALKTLADEKGLLMMGPDCGLSFINGYAIGLCSKVRRGSVGIAAASGSGMQEVMNMIHRLGGGVSHAIGVGGLDLSEAVGGRTMLRSLDILENDRDTRVIVLISKPPAHTTAEKIFEKVKACKKPVVAQFINCDESMALEAGAYPSISFEDTARMAVALSEGRTYEPQSEAERFAKLDPLAAKEAGRLAAGQKYLRGLYCGGSLAEETITLAHKKLGPIYGNIAFAREYQLDDPFASRENCLIDMGAEAFTKGKPHVAIDPSPRVARFVQEARDRQTAVILMDFLLGYSLCEDPAGMMDEVICAERARAASEGRHLCVIASICGSDLDPQDMARQEKTLRDAGVLVMRNNGEASRLAALVIEKQRRRMHHA